MLTNKRARRFSVAWWSYTFPMTTASMAAIKYAEEVPAFLSKGLALGLVVISSAIVSSLCISTLLHGFVWRSLFPNDLAIAISRNKNNSSIRKTTSAKDTQPAARSRYDNLRRWTKKSLIPTAVDNHSSGHGSDDKRFTI